MLLAVDIGNTNIKLALFKGNNIFRRWRLATNKEMAFKEYNRRLQSLFREMETAHVAQIVICSVVPRLSVVFKKALFVIFRKRPLMLGEDIIVPIKNLYSMPGQVGQDRLVNALAAVSKFGAPIIVVDFGTAVTFDLISAKASYLGGIIVPGMEVALRALVNNADLLPKISLNPPKAFLGKETVSSMQSGIVYGYSFLVKGILERLKRQVRPTPRTIATGGKGPLIIQYCNSIDTFDENLTLEGIKMAFQGGKRAKKLKE